MQVFFGIILLSIPACEMFTTRDPEPPSTGKSSFVPPTEPNIVIENFKNSLLEKNADNYIACFADSTKQSKSGFYFYPSGSAIASFPSVFEYWALDSERRYFNSMIRYLTGELSIVLSLSNGKMDYVSPDSTLYVADYILQVPHNLTDLPKEYRGYLQFTLAKQRDGLWNISRWFDNNPKMIDTANATWSLLKARLSN